MRNKFFDWRIHALFFLFISVGVILILRLFQLQVAQYAFYKAVADDQRGINLKLSAERGKIFVQDKKGEAQPVALNKDWSLVYAIPKEIENPEEAASAVSAVLGVPREDILKRLKKENDPYEPLARKVSDETAEQIKKLGVRGIGIASESGRFYPFGVLASQVLGFFGPEGDKKAGRYGVEKIFNEELEGTQGELRGEKDGFGYIISTIKKFIEPAKDGADIYLTIDPNIQFAAEEKIKKAIERWSAEAGSVIVMEPATGKILALANFPTFNPNEYSKEKEPKVFSNAAIQEVFEPGSVFKPFTMAAGLDTKALSPSTVYTDEGEVKIGGYTIRNFNNRAFGKRTMTEVLENSLNTGAVFAQRAAGKSVFKNYVKAFGFGEKTGVDLPFETAGNILNLDSGREINYATASFGQGISATPLELITAISAIANDGKLMKPHIVDKIVSKDGAELKIVPEIVRQAISPLAANQLTAMLVSVVRNGFDKARISGYFIAGKTGTAQIPDLENGGYLDGVFIHTFVGYAPAFNPRFAILLKIDKPKGITFAADSLSPIFKELTEYILNYYEIPPDEK